MYPTHQQFFRQRYLAALLLASVVQTGAAAQELETDERQEQRRRARAEATAREQLAQQPRVTLQENTAASPANPDALTLPSESPCFVIEQVALSIPPQLPPTTHALAASALMQDRFYFAQQYLQQYQGACIGNAGVNLIVQRLTAQILAKGYSTTRLGITAQDLSTGRLILTLVPGVIHTIRFADPATAATWRNAFPTGPGQLLNLQDIEQGLEQMKRVPSQDVDMEIVPATLPGESDIVITVRQRRPWKVSVSLDDSGSKASGKLQSGIQLALDNLLGINDLFNLGINSDAQRQGQLRGTSGANLYYAVPYGYWTFSLAASSYDYHQQIAGLNQSFVSSGKARNLDLSTQQLFYRDQYQKHSWQFKLGKRWSRSYIDDTEIEVQRRNTSYAEIAWLHTHYLGTGQLNLTLANRWGVSWFNAQPDLPSRSADAPTYRYTLQSLDASLYAPFSLGSQSLNYIGSLRAQTTRSALFQSEQFAIGNRYTVRGFDGEQTLTAERGIYLRNELELPLAHSAQALYAGLDGGRVFGPSTHHLLGDKLAGAVVGARGTLAGLHYDVFIAAPLVKPQGLKSAPVSGFSLHYQY